jgi:hypothetical protein
MSSAFESTEEIVERAKNAAGLIVGASENRTWIELLFEGDLMHTKTIHLPAMTGFDVYVEEIPHKTTVYEHPRTMIFFNRPCDLVIVRDGNKIVVRGSPMAQIHSLT